MVKRKRNCGRSKKEKASFELTYKPRFNGRENIFEPWYIMSEAVNIRMYYGGHFVTKKNKTTYERHPSVAPKDFGVALRLNVEEVCFFEFKYWIMNDLGFNEIGEIWFRKQGCSLFNRRSRIMSDADIPLFLQSPERDGFYHLYVIYPEKEEESVNRLAYGPGVTFYLSSPCETDGSNEMGSVSESINNSLEGGPQDSSTLHSLSDNPRSESTPNTQISLTQPTSAASQPHFSPSLSKIQSEQPKSLREKLPILSKEKKQAEVPLHSDIVELDKEGSVGVGNGDIGVGAGLDDVLIGDTVEERDSGDFGEGDRGIERATVEGEEEDMEENSGERTDSDDSDVCLSEDDFEDKEDDDLFHENVDEDITERVTRSLGYNKVNEPGGDGEGAGFADEEDLVDSDGEAGSVIGSDDDDPNYPEFNPVVDFKRSIVLSKGLKFPSNAIFRKALRHHAIENGYDYYYLHNSNQRVSAYCVKRYNCPWKRARLIECQCNSKKKCRFRIHCRKLKGEETWQIKSLRLNHSCGWQSENSKLTSQYLAERYLEDWRDDPDWKLSAFIKRAERECKAKVLYYKAYYAKKRALKMIFGDSDKEYEKVWDYVAAIKKYNPGSTAVVKVTGVETAQPQFERMYVCLKACKEGFIAGCRPLLGVDGAHLKGAYPGILLTAVGKDGNNNIFPVAWAVVEIENAETWAWFLQLLRDDIASVADAVTWVHEQDELTYMSDRQKGLLDAFKSVMPNAETRYCCRHIWSNFKNKYPGVIYKEHFWKAARSSTKEHFKIHMDTIKNINVEAYNYLMAIPVAHWSRHAFGTSSKSGMLLNNCCESFNNVLREARAKPILQLMEWVRRYVMGRFFAKKDGLRNFSGHIMPSVVRLIHKGLKEVSNMRVRQADLWEFEVDHEEWTYVVNLESQTCNCNRWRLMGIPCWHALACLEIKRLDYEDYIHPAYHVTTYAKAYAPAFRAMPGQLMWDETPYPKPLPPPHRNMPGRPSKHKRTKEVGEDEERRNVKRAKKQNRCSNCGGLGHYYTSCKSPIAEGARGSSSKGGMPSSEVGSQAPPATPGSVIKRKPGRPKKGEATPVTTPSTVNSSQARPTRASDGSKRKPGRPRKDGAAPSSAATTTTRGPSTLATPPSAATTTRAPPARSTPPVQPAAAKKGKRVKTAAVADILASQHSISTSAPPLPSSHI